MSLAMSCWYLFRPHPYTWLLGTTLLGALIMALLARFVFQAPISIIAIAAVATVMSYLVVKFRADSHRFGLNLALLQLLLIAQLAHFVEHSVQVYQIHILGIPRVKLVASSPNSTAKWCISGGTSA